MFNPKMRQTYTVIEKSLLYSSFCIVLSNDNYNYNIEFQTYSCYEREACEGFFFYEISVTTENKKCQPFYASCKEFNSLVSISFRVSIQESLLINLSRPRPCIN